MRVGWMVAVSTLSTSDTVLLPTATAAAAALLQAAVCLTAAARSAAAPTFSCWLTCVTCNYEGGSKGLATADAAELLQTT